MEITAYNFLFLGFSTPVSLFVAFAITGVCCLLAALFTFRSKTKSESKSVSLRSASVANSGKNSCNCTCFCGEKAFEYRATTAHLNGGSTAGAAEIVEEEMVEKASVALAERQTGASMMEQLVPEITTHALSYLDYPSLCRLSMTNSLMRKAANDDNAWKALYHKDFTVEQDTVTPVNGWKAYYAATRAVVNVNGEFFRIIRERSVPEMGRFWLNSDYVKCFHASGEFFTGYNAVMESWQLAFNWEQNVDFQIRDVRVRVLTDVAWVTMKAYVDINLNSGPFIMTNVFEFHNGRWYMVHHHSSVMVMNAGPEQQIVLGG